MNSTMKYSLFAVVTIVIAYIYLKPIIIHENEFRIVVVNISERPVAEITLTGNGMDTKKIGPIHVGDMQDHYFIPSQDGPIHYSIYQDKLTFNGVIKADLKKNEVGEKYIVIGEMHNVRVYDDYDSAY